MLPLKLPFLLQSPGKEVNRHPVVKSIFFILNQGIATGRSAPHSYPVTSGGSNVASPSARSAPQTTGLGRLPMPVGFFGDACPKGWGSLGFLLHHTQKGYSTLDIDGCGSKSQYQNGTLVSGNMDQHLRNPCCLNFEPHPYHTPHWNMESVKTRDRKRRVESDAHQDARGEMEKCLLGQFFPWQGMDLLAKRTKDKGHKSWPPIGGTTKTWTNIGKPKGQRVDSLWAAQS